MTARTSIIGVSVHGRWAVSRVRQWLSLSDHPGARSQYQRLITARDRRSDVSITMTIIIIRPSSARQSTETAYGRERYNITRPYDL